MITEDGFEVTIEQSDFSFIRDEYELSVRQVIKLQEVQLVRGELIQDEDFLLNLIDQMKERIRDRIGSNDKEKES